MHREKHLSPPTQGTLESCQSCLISAATRTLLLLSLFTAGIGCSSVPSHRTPPPFDNQAFLNSQKDLYRQHDWESFFGAAQAYRLFHWQSSPSPTAIELEALALIRLCRYPEALELTQSLRQWSATQSNSQAVLPLLDEIEALVPGIDKLKAQLPSERVSAPSFQTVRWPQPKIEAAKQYPLNAFRVKIEGRCS